MLAYRRMVRAGRKSDPAPAAGSSIAQLVHGLARRRGVRVVGIVRSPRADTLAFPALVDGDEPLAGGILRLTGGEPVAGLLDSIGGRSIVDALPALGAGATIVSYAVLGQEPAVLSNADMIYRNLRWIGFGIDRWLSTNGARRESMLRDLWDAIQRGAIELPVRSRHPLHNLHDALDDAQATRTHGKVLIVS